MLRQHLSERPRGATTYSYRTNQHHRLSSGTLDQEAASLKQKQTDRALNQ